MSLCIRCILNTKSIQARSLLRKCLLPLYILLNNNRAIHLLAQPLSPLWRQFGCELQSTRPLHRLNRHLKVRQGLVIRNHRVWQHERTQCNLTSQRSIFRKDDLEEMCRYCDVGWRPNHLVRDTPLAVCLALWEVQRACDDPHGRICVCKPTAKVLEMRPIVAIESISDLRAHVAQRKCIVHSFLAPLRIRSWHLVPAIVSAAEVVL